MGAYGYNIEHILMVDIIPDPSVRKAMNEINAGLYPWKFCSPYRSEFQGGCVECTHYIVSLFCFEIFFNLCF